MSEMNPYFAKLAATMRAGLTDSRWWTACAWSGSREERAMSEMNPYFAKLAATMRAGLTDDSAPSPNAATMPDLAPSPELLKIIAMAKEGTRGIIDLDDEDWQVLIDETLYQIARALHRDESIVLPSLGKLEIVYGDGGPWGRLTLDEAVRPEVVL